MDKTNKDLDSSIFILCKQ